MTDWQNDNWIRPPQPQPARRRPPMTPAQQRSARRRREERRRRQQRNLLLATLAAVLVVSGIITLLLPPSAKTDPTTSVSLDKPAADPSLVAELPYGGGSGTSSAPTLDWGAVGPQRQSGEDGYLLTTAADPALTALEPGRVTTQWFDDAAFLGDSLTVGLSYYGIDVGDALICGYEGTSPNQIVNRTTLHNDDRGDEVAMDVLAAAQPAKLYILLGTNALVADGDYEGFLNYYARMLDELRGALPHTAIYVQSILPVRPEALQKAPGLNSQRLGEVNQRLRALCAERGCTFVDISAALSDDSGALLAEAAQTDGIHLTKSGYSKWISCLCSSVPYSKNNPWQAGSVWYLDERVKNLIADIP